MKCAILFTGLAFSCQVCAGTITTLDLTPIDRDAAVSYNQWLANALTAGTEAESQLVEQISLRMNWFHPNAYPILAITGSTGGKPDLSDIRVMADMSPLEDITPGTTVQTLTFQPDPTFGEPLLEPDQEYWLVFGFTAPDHDQDLPAGLSYWSYAATSAGVQNIDGWSIASKTATGNTDGQNWSTELTTPYSFGISLIPVPEPASTLLLLSGFGLLIHRRSRRP